MGSGDRMEWLDRGWVLAKAEAALEAQPRFITDAQAPMSEGGIHDYYSNGDYWWPNPDTPDGLPYVRRDGESNPGSFNEHREIMRSLRTNVAHLAAGYAVSGKEAYADKAVSLLNSFFLAEETRMNPHLLYAQAIPGICSGRGIGIIDTLHLIEVPVAIECLSGSSYMTPEIMAGLQGWFRDYLRWMLTHPYGIEERDTDNNHSVCWHVQAAVFARFVGEEEVLDFCRSQYKKVLLPDQMAADGSFPRELQRTKPYGYSIFVLDNMITLCHVLSTPEDCLWDYELEEGRGIRRGLDYLYPYMADKASWPYPPDIEHDQGWPAAVSGLLFAGVALAEPAYIELWRSLDPDPVDPEVRRNMAIRQPLLWL
ncbi:Alginate lyase [Chlamydia abortus]|nr:Alginate lyase [Chlamydia abortus]